MSAPWTFCTSQQRQRDGIYVEDTPWKLITELQQEYELNG